ncbi:MAG: PQQ-binding-like beta-propeller repeat protein [Pirellulaceae bacterium]|nr:PQQ-like beta-propeller repeat protein [Planctomycetales bacterium]
MRTIIGVLLLFMFSTTSIAEDWPQWRGPRRDGSWKEEGLVTEFTTNKIPHLWRQPIGAGYSGPTVSNGRVFVMDRLTEPVELERVHCFDAQSGDVLWKFEYPCAYTISYTAGPRASVTVDGDRCYALGAMGHLHCLDAASGQRIWQQDLDQRYHLQDHKRMPIWGIAASPLIHSDLVIVLTGADEGASVVAFDKATGEEQWKSLNDRGQYSSPITIRQQERDVVVCWTGDAVNGLEPATGKTLWRVAMPVSRMPIGVATPIVNNNRLFVTSFYDGSMLVQLAENDADAERLWHEVGPSERETKALHSIISTPVFLKDHIYGVDSYGELRCIAASDGQRIWEDQAAVPKSRWSTIHFVTNGDRVWMFNERGELIIATLDPDGYHEISRATLIEPTEEQLRQRNGVCWSHPAFANRRVYARNDREIVCADLAAKP